MSRPTAWVWVLAPPPAHCDLGVEPNLLLSDSSKDDGWSTDLTGLLGASYDDWIHVKCFKEQQYIESSLSSFFLSENRLLKIIMWTKKMTLRGLEQHRARDILVRPLEFDPHPVCTDCEIFIFETTGPDSHAGTGWEPWPLGGGGEDDCCCVPWNKRMLWGDWCWESAVFTWVAGPA